MLDNLRGCIYVIFIMKYELTVHNTRRKMYFENVLAAHCELNLIGSHHTALSIVYYKAHD